MNARSYTSPFALEALDGRRMMSTVAYGDFNNDGRVDMAAISSPTTITVSLARADGSYAVSATLTTQNNRPATSIEVGDFNADGRVDIKATGGSNGTWYVHQWLGNGNGTF